MKILIITQYFWPESFRINDVALGLHNRGHEVVVLTGKPNYPQGKFFEGYGFFKKRKQVWNNIRICRVPLIPRGDGSGAYLFFNYLSFVLTASVQVAVMRKDFDCVLVYGLSPVTAGIPATFLKKFWKKPYHFWVQDLWPASITAAAGIKNGFIIGILEYITRLIYHFSETVLVQSIAFKSYIINQGVSEGKIIYLPNSTEPFTKVECNDRLSGFGIPKGFNLLFAGNIGSAQSFHTLLEAADIVKQRGLAVNWIILGDGRMKKEVEAKIRVMDLNTCFFLLGRFPVIDMPAFYACADALLLSLKKDAIFSLTIPSKLQSYMAFGKPIVASIDGEGARIIKEAAAGFISPAEDAVGLAKKIEEILSTTKAELVQMGNNARDYFNTEFEREALLDRLEGVLKRNNE